MKEDKKNINIDKKDLDRLLSDIDRECNLAMAKIKRLQKKKIDLIKSIISKNDEKRLRRLRKKILNKK